MLTGLGIVVVVKLVSLKHSNPSSLFLVFEMQTENPRKVFFGYPLFKKQQIHVKTYTAFTKKKTQNKQTEGNLSTKRSRTYLYPFLIKKKSIEKNSALQNICTLYIQHYILLIRVQHTNHRTTPFFQISKKKHLKIIGIMYVV